MFGLTKNKTKNNKIDKDESGDFKEKVSQDIRVHNMPNWQKQLASSKTEYSDFDHGSGLAEHIGVSSAGSKTPHRAVGLIIIGGGLILIGALVYFSFLFIIKPSLQTETIPSEIQTEVIEEETQPIFSQIEINPESSTQIIETNPVILSIEETEEVSTSSEEEIMAEEGLVVLTEDLEPILDSDEDGLNDEEELLLGTDINNNDTNGNTYQDLVEVENNYNPLGLGALASNPNLLVYTDDVYGFQLLYPREFEYDSLNNNQVLLFSVPDGSFFQISIQENLEKEDLSTWYAKMFPESPVSYDRIKMGNTWEGIESQNSLNFYLMSSSKDNIFTISYIPAIADRIAYPNIFSMLINSFSFL